MTRKAAVVLFVSLWIAGLASPGGSKTPVDTPQI